jgi:polyisoprenoid-binding protein YceI
MRNRHLVGVIVGLALPVVAAMAPSAATNLVVDPARSRVVIDVGKAGVFGFAGHLHEVAAPSLQGTVTFDPADWRKSSVSLSFNAAALKVTGKGDPPADVPKVQQVMLSDRVLDAAKFPSISFKSRSISILSRSGTSADVSIEGDATLHGVTRPVSVKAHASLEGADTLTTSGTFPLKQTDFGIEPVTAAAGSVRVRDEVEIHFTLVAHR